MILNDLLSRQKQDDSNQHEIIPIFFKMQNVLQTRYYSISEREQGKYLVLTRLQVKSRGISLQEAHGVDKGIYPNIRLEKTSYKANNNI